MKTVFRARVKPDGPRRYPWVTGGCMDTMFLGHDLHVVRCSKYMSGGYSYQTQVVDGDYSRAGWYIHEDDLDFFESWVEWPDGAKLVASTYTAERFLPEMT